MYGLYLVYFLKYDMITNPLTNVDAIIYKLLMQ